MSYYEISKIGKSSKCQSFKVVTTIILEAQNKQYLIIIVENGYIEVYVVNTLSHVGKIKVMLKQIHVKNILSASTYNQMTVLQTFKEIYIINMQDMLEKLLLQKPSNYQINNLNFTQAQLHIKGQYTKLSNKQIKLIFHRQNLHLKMIGRSKQQIYYICCTIKDKYLLVEDSHKIRLKNEYKISLQSVDKDVIFYESYVNKFKSIKVELLQYHSHFQGRDTEMVQKYEIYQFQERCCVNNIYKVNSELLCILTNSHFEDQSQSNIIIFNFKQKYTMNNIVLNDFLLMQSYLPKSVYNKQITFGNIDFMIQCIGHQENQLGVKQVVPLAGNKWESAFKNQYDYYELAKNHLILYSQRNQQLTIHRKISKRAIYFNWLQQEFSKASGIFSDILDLL